jgi:hypothetical protein
MSDTTTPEIKWPGYVPPPEREGMRLARIEIRQGKAGEYYFSSIGPINCWRICDHDTTSIYPISIYEPGPIFCPECGAEMKPVLVKLTGEFSLGCSSNHTHFAGPCKPTSEEALSAAECLRGLWEKKQEKKV